MYKLFDEKSICPLCGDSARKFLGKLGKKLWLKCSSCGEEYSLSEK